MKLNELPTTSIAYSGSCTHFASLNIYEDVPRSIHIPKTDFNRNGKSVAAVLFV